MCTSAAPDGDTPAHTRSKWAASTAKQQWRHVMLPGAVTTPEASTCCRIPSGDLEEPRIEKHRGIFSPMGDGSEVYVLS